jgi:protein-disulfide isomerase
MNATRLLALLALLFASFAPATAAPRKPARHTTSDWARTATMTPEGGIRIGNPAARVRLVEYGSFTCPHCAAFAKEAFVPLRDRYVRTGKMSFEFRPALRDGVDMMAALTAYCGGPAHFFGIADALYVQQESWMNAAAEWAQAHQAENVEGEGAMAALAQGAGLTAIAGKAGIAQPRYDQCLADPAARERLAKIAGDAWNVRQIGGTPAFYLNDDKLDGVYGWASLEPRLKAAIAG